MKRSYIRHGMTGTPEFGAWINMKQRCKYSKWYIKKGIKVCDEWQDDFIAFYDHIGPRPNELFSVDRIDSSRNYEPGNVRWATASEQSNNTSRCLSITFDGKTMNLKQWSKETGIPYQALLHRRRWSWSVEKMLTTPVKNQYQRFKKV